MARSGSVARVGSVASRACVGLVGRRRTPLPPGPTPRGRVGTSTLAAPSYKNLRSGVGGFGVRGGCVGGRPVGRAVVAGRGGHPAGATERVEVRADLMIPDVRVATEALDESPGGFERARGGAVAVGGECGVGVCEVVGCDAAGTLSGRVPMAVATASGTTPLRGRWETRRPVCAVRRESASVGRRAAQRVEYANVSRRRSRGCVAARCRGNRRRRVSVSQNGQRTRSSIRSNGQLVDRKAVRSRAPQLVVTSSTTSRWSSSWPVPI